MPSALPDGEPAPDNGALPSGVQARVEQGPLGLYLHVPFCRVRCGYCDFNTYAPGDLTGHGDDLAGYPSVAVAELDLAVRVLGERRRPVDTVFVGGGTPTLLPSRALVGLLDAVRERFGLAPDAEVTTEANPDTMTPAYAQALAAGGFTRLSVGMQSAVPSVLATLDRAHSPQHVARAVRAGREAGLATSVDLIYGTPGESLADWETSLDEAVMLEPDHISAYALVVEEGTRLAAQVGRGVLPAPDDDDEAAKYEIADRVLAAAGYRWYELSNWAREEPAQAARPGRCRHNEGYWLGGQWWGIGPGAHSHLGGVRWWNVKHPRAYAQRLGSGVSPAAGREVLTDAQVYAERVLLGIRLAGGLPLDSLAEAGREAVPQLERDGFVAMVTAGPGRSVALTLRGRLFADLVTRRLLGW